MIKYLKEIDSTSTYIKEHLNELDNFDIVSAEHQLNGRGRTGHYWEDQSNQNVLCSILIKDKDIIDSYNILSIAVGVIVSNYLKAYLKPNDISIKWPNDVYILNKKVCGILLEGSLPNYVIIGIGLNVNQKDFEIDNATSLSIETEYEFNIDDVRKIFFDYLLSSLKSFMTSKEAFIKQFNRSNYLKDKLVSFNYLNQSKQGVVKDINEDGSLQILLDDKLFNVFADEINLIR